MKIPNPFYALLMLSLIGPPASALADDQDEDEAIRFYDVEVIIFKNIRAPKSREFVLPVTLPNRQGEFFDLASGRHLSGESIEKLEQNGNSPAASGNAEQQQDLSFQLLQGDDLRLLDKLARIIESPRYELLLHAAWRQPGLPAEETTPVWIRGGRIFGEEYISIDSQFGSVENELSGFEGESGEINFDEQSLESIQQRLQQQALQNDTRSQLYELEGKISIGLSRYLHARVDLVMRRPRLSIDPVLDSSEQDQVLAIQSADTRILNNHRLREHRRMRSKNLHYLDNPEFAMLILITPYEAPAEPETETTAEISQ